MGNWIRTILIVSVLIGGTTFFGYRSLNQLNGALNDIESASYTAMVNTSLTSFRDKTQEVETSTADIVSDPETPLNLSLIFPDNSDVFYIGCTYKLSLESSTTIDSLGVALMDAGTEEASGPITSGLAREYEIEPDVQSLDWKVGAVRPGEYFILISKINGIEEEVKSEYFLVHKMSEGVSTGERENICKGSGGLLI